MYNLRYSTSDADKMSVMGIDTEAFVASITQDETLRAVLCGNNILYAGRGNETPFYIHALIQNSYLESAWKCVNGGGQIARCLARNIRASGGLIRTRSGVAKFVEEDGRIDHVLLANGEKVHGDFFISNIHPAVTIDMVQGQTLRSGYRRRITEVKDTVGCFTLYVSLKPRSLPYEQTNYYVHEPGRLWNMVDYQPDEWPLGYAVFFGKDPKDPAWASTLSVITYMRYEDVLPWADSYNTAASPCPRAPEYQAFKQRMTERLLDRMEEKFPDIRAHVLATYASTPLTFRDYLGDRSGSMYGIAKDYRHVLETHIASRTRIHNLFLTGQNLNLHGILGTTISALITVRDLTGNDSIIEKIRNGNAAQAHP
jgi:all-trans-retinol 13,14-reductase